MGALPPCPYAAILIAAAPASFFFKTGKLGYHRGALWIKTVFPKGDISKAQVRPWASVKHSTGGLLSP